MRCLMCGKTIREESFADLFRKEDILCAKCRGEWNRNPRRFRFAGHEAYTIYEYEGGFAKSLLQYKECCDEALRDVFLYPDRARLARAWRKRTLVLLPSSEQKKRERGFSHLRQMFSCLNLPMIEPFEKTEAGTQKMRSAKERRRMQEGIRLLAGQKIPGRIVLADDVITTGATMKGALAALPEGTDVRIFACAFTRAPQEDSARG